MKTLTIGWLNKCGCGNKSHTVKTARGNESALWDDDAVKCNSCGRGGVIQVCEGQARVLWETDEEMAEVKPMSTLTKEWLLKTISELEEERDATPGAVNEDAALALAAMKIALASLEAEAVAWLLSGGGAKNNVSFDSGNAYADPLREVTPLYTAPPAPVSVPAAMEMDDDFDSAFEHGKAVGWNAYRAAMLQSFGNSEQLNSPVIPDGWVLVPIEPTEDMIVNGFESEPDYSFSDEREWEAYDAMSGCQQAAHRAKLCWAAMIAASQKS